MRHPDGERVNRAGAWRAGLRPRRLVAIVCVLLGSALAAERFVLADSPDALFINPAGRVGIGTTDPQRALDVAGVARAQSFEGNGAVPVGGIIMWSGSANEIPPGWALCDGKTPNVPDLRDRFVIGAGGSFQAGTPGGSSSYKLTVDQMPSHDHGGATQAGGLHDHIVGANVGSMVNYPLPTRADAYQRNLNSQVGPPVQGVGVVLGAEFSDQEFAREIKSMRTHSIHKKYVFISSQDGDHTHAISPQGGGQPYQVMPPYYALAFIMRVQ